LLCGSNEGCSWANNSSIGMRSTDTISIKEENKFFKNV
jgi:hypothetical protein